MFIILTKKIITDENKISTLYSLLTIIDFKLKQDHRTISGCSSNAYSKIGLGLKPINHDDRCELPYYERTRIEYYFTFEL